MRRLMIGGFAGMTGTLRFLGHSMTARSLPRKKIDDFPSLKNSRVRSIMMAIRSKTLWLPTSDNREESINEDRGDGWGRFHRIGAGQASHRSHASPSTCRGQVDLCG